MHTDGAAAELAHGVRLVMALPEAANRDFNLPAKGVATLDLSQIRAGMHRPERPFRHLHDTDRCCEVPFRAPDARRAKAVPGFAAKPALDEMLDDVIARIRAAMAADTLTSTTRA